MGKLSKLTHILFLTIWVAFTFLTPLFMDLEIVNMIRYILLALLAIYVVFVIFFSRYIKQSLISIGNIKISKSAITKSIGDLVKVHYYRNIREIHLKKHMKAFFFPRNTDGSQTYIMTIIDYDLTEEKFIVASQPSDKPDINLLKVLLKLEQITGEKVNIIR